MLAALMASAREFSASYISLRKGLTCEGCWGSFVIFLTRKTLPFYENELQTWVRSGFLLGCVNFTSCFISSTTEVRFVKSGVKNRYISWYVPHR